MKFKSGDFVEILPSSDGSAKHLVGERFHLTCRESTNDRFWKTPFPSAIGHWGVRDDRLKLVYDGHEPCKWEDCEVEAQS